MTDLADWVEVKCPKRRKAWGELYRSKDSQLWQYDDVHHGWVIAFCDADGVKQMATFNWGSAPEEAPPRVWLPAGAPKDPPPFTPVEEEEIEIEDFDDGWFDDDDDD